MKSTNGSSKRCGGKKSVAGKSKRLGHVKNMDPKLRVIICAKCGNEIVCEKGVEYFRYVCPVCKKGKLVRKA